MKKQFLPTRSRRLVAAATMAATMALGGAAVATSPAAQAEPAGQYYYQCVLTNGSSYWIYHGQTLRCTNASYLKKYINGSLVASYHLTANGTEATYTAAQAAKDLNCVLAIGDVVLAAKSGGGLVRAYNTLSSIWRGIPSCKA